MIVIATQPPSGKRYYVAFSVRNNNEREITVRTTLAEPYQLFHVRPSDTFTINVAHNSAQPVFIQAVDRTTGTPITLNGKQSITLIPQDTPAVPQLYSAPNQCKLQLSLLLIHVYRIIAGEQERSQPKTRGGGGGGGIIVEYTEQLEGRGHGLPEKFSIFRVCETLLQSF